MVMPPLPLLRPLLLRVTGAKIAGDSQRALLGKQRSIANLEGEKREGVCVKAA
jgi:hypothetical protein